MAANFATDFGQSELPARQATLSFEHRFFLTVAVLFPLITVIGFAPSYYLKPAFNTPPLPSVLVHAHGLVMSLWIVLFAVQAYLISSKRVKLHMTLGLSSVVLAALMMVTGMMTAGAAAKRGSGFPGYPPLVFLSVPVTGMVVFAILFAAALYYRKNAANHKRLMLVTVLIFLSPSISRLPLPFIPVLGSIWFFGVPSLIGIALLIGDTYRNGKLNTAFLAGVVLATIPGPLMLLFARTELWLEFAAWMTGS
jgi:uncharacterized membrane protein YozB (DUF420 family)